MTNKKANINPQVFESMMKGFRDEFDPEMAHVLADELLCKMLEEFGYNEGIKVYREMKKW